MSTTTTTHGPRDTAVVRHFRTGSPAGFLPQLNRDLEISLSEAVFLRLQTYFKLTALRDPTVGELRLLDALSRPDLCAPDRIAVGELITQSPAIAATWADMMAKHSLIHGALTSASKNAAATPPCSLSDALTLTAKYIRRTEVREEPAPHDLDQTLLLPSPDREALAAASGYTPAARIRVGGHTLSLWTRNGEPLPKVASRPGDLLLYLPRVRPSQITALLADELQHTHPAVGALRAVADAPLLLLLTELCPAAEVRVSKLTEGAQTDGHIPLDLLCTRPTAASDGTCAYLVRVPLKQVQTMNQILKDAGISSMVCGQVRTGGNMVIYIHDSEGNRDLPAATLPAALLHEVAGATLLPMSPEAADLPLPAVTAPALTRLPSLNPREDGLTPDGRETVALTIHDGDILKIPEADALLAARATEITDPRSAYSAAAETTAAAAKLLGELGVSPEHIRLTVVITAAEESLLTDGTVLAAICGIYQAAAGLAVPVEDSLIHRTDSPVPLSVTVTAWAQDKALCTETAHGDDRQWRNHQPPIHKECPAFVFPVLRRSYEDSLKAFAAALNRNSGAACSIRPLAMNPVRDEEGQVTGYVLHPESRQKLVDELSRLVIPVFSMNEGDTRLLLSDPAVVEALRRRVENGWSSLVLGESCKPFAELGLLPAPLLDVHALPIRADRATVTYTFPAEPSSRLLRTSPLSPAVLSDALNAPHILTLHLPDGTAIPDGFIGSDGKVLGLLNGLDTTVLPKVGFNNYTL